MNPLDSLRHVASNPNVWQRLSACRLAFSRPSVSTIAAAASREPVRARHGMVASTTSRFASRRRHHEARRQCGRCGDRGGVCAGRDPSGRGKSRRRRLHDDSTARTERRPRSIIVRWRRPPPPQCLSRQERQPDQRRRRSSLVGYRAAGVPGTVRGMELALKKYGSGKLTWSQLVEPARRLAAERFSHVAIFARALAARQRLPVAVSGNQTDLSCTTESSTTKARFFGNLNWPRRSRACKGPGQTSFTRARLRN